MKDFEDDKYENEGFEESAEMVGETFNDDHDQESFKAEIEEKNLDMANQIIKEARKHKKSFNNNGMLKIGNQFVGEQIGYDLPQVSKLDAKLNDIIDKIGLYQNLSKFEIEKVKQDIVNEPPSVLEGLRVYYTEKIKPVLQRREEMLKQQVEHFKGQNVSIFLYVSSIGRDEEDGSIKEQEQFKSADLSKKPGFEIYHGQTVQQLRADQTPFPAPSELFKAEPKKEEELKNKQEPVKTTPKMSM